MRVGVDTGTLMEVDVEGVTGGGEIVVAAVGPGVGES
jgi:hypothetical protein